MESADMTKPQAHADALENLELLNYLYVPDKHKTIVKIQSVYARAKHSRDSELVCHLHSIKRTQIPYERALHDY